MQKSRKMQVPSLGKEDTLEKDIYPLLYSYLEKSHGQSSLAGNSPLGCKGVRQNLATKQQHARWVTIIYGSHPATAEFSGYIQGMQLT